MKVLTFLVAVLIAVCAAAYWGSSAWTASAAGTVYRCGSSTGVNGVTVYIHNYHTGGNGATTTRSAPYPGWYGFTGLVGGWMYRVYTARSGVTFISNGGNNAINLCV